MENQNRALQDNCAVHYQPLLKIVDQDYQRVCLKCLRVQFLKRDQAQLQRQIEGDVALMQEGYAQMCREYGIIKNVQKEYCDFTTEAMQRVSSALDAAFISYKTKIQTLLELQVLQDAQLIEVFHSKFSAVDHLVSEHANMQTRSLFQVFVDNLTLPTQIASIKSDLDCLKTPTTVKEAFQKMVAKCERTFKLGCEQMLEESGVTTAASKRR